MSWIVDNHKELHILCAIGLVVASAVHTAAHLAYIVPALSSSAQNLQELNNMTSCGMCALGTGKCDPLHPNFVEWPACPFEKIPQYYLLTFLSTTGVSGILLWATLLLLWYCSHRERRTSDYNVFQHVHTIGMPMWLFQASMLIGGGLLCLSALVMGALRLCDQRGEEASS